MTWLMNLGFAGGEQPLVIDANTMLVKFEDRELVVTRGEYMAKLIYAHGSLTNPASTKKRISVDWSKWLPTDVSISTSTWTVEDNRTNVIAVSDESKTSTGTVSYITAKENNRELHLTNTIVTDAAIPETESRSFLIKTVVTF